MKIFFKPRRAEIRAAFWILVGVLVLSTVSSAISTNQPAHTFIQPDSVLIQLRDDSQTATHSAIVFGDEWFWLPANLLVRASTPPVDLRTSAASLNVSTSADWFGQMYGFSKPESWVLDRSAITAMVDLVGGISVMPAEDLQIRDENKLLMVLKAGYQTQLSGTPAGLYALSSETAFEQVWRALMADLDAAYLPTVLPAIGAASRSSLELNDLVSYIEKLQVRTQQGSLEFHRLAGRPKLVQDQIFDVLTDAELRLLLDAGLVAVES